jgi:predicted dehydrogenase
VTAAAARGLPVFCEKPLATDLAGAAAMLDAVQTAGVVNQVGLVLRDTPPFQLLHHLVHQPENGRIMAVVLRDDQFLPVQGLYESTWRGDPARAGAGTLLEHSIHDVDLLEWFAGPIATAGASAATFHGIEGIEDAVVAELRFASGALGSLVSVWHDVLERPSMRRVEVFCERAHVWLDDDERGSVHVTRTGADAETVRQAEVVDRLTGAGIAVRNPDAAFVDAVVRGEPAWPDLAVAWRAHVVTDALYASAAAGGSMREVPELSNRPSS